jgi:BirA family transcriptional regulator, biotin operon repressor / biotin---[acetyl-CoA-carboxylase] ligase
MWNDLERPPLRVESLRHGLLVPNGPFAALDVVPEAGSTNEDLRLAAAEGAPDRSVLVAEYQSAGRGRVGRHWTVPPRSGLLFSVLLRPDGVPSSRWGWLSLITGVALASAVSEVAEVDTKLKWPNDLLLGPGQRKAAGILAEVVNGSVIVGVGLNVTLREAELPVPEATSLAIEGASTTDRDTVLRVILRELATVDRDWRAAGGDADACGLRERYLRLCATIGESVRIELPSGSVLLGTAADVDRDGRLVVRDGDGAEHAVAAGDVVHVRPAPQ